MNKLSSYISPTIEAAGAAGVADGPEPTPTLVVPVVVVALVAVAVAEVVAAAVAVAVDAVATAVVVIGGCFSAGTKITMSDGTLKPIETICVGDWVAAYDPQEKKKIGARVVETFHHTPDEMSDYYLIVNGSLKVTPNHPMFVNGKWKDAGELQIGDSLWNNKGKNVIVRSIDKVFQRIAVYNLEVDKYHTYFAGGLLVHNKESLSSTTGATATR